MKILKNVRRHALFNGGGIPMKLALGVIVFVDLKAGDVVSHSVQNNVYTSVQLLSLIHISEPTRH